MAQQTDVNKESNPTPINSAVLLQQQLAALEQKKKPRDY